MKHQEEKTSQGVTSRRSLSRSRSVLAPCRLCTSYIATDWCRSIQTFPPVSAPTLWHFYCTSPRFAFWVLIASLQLPSCVELQSFIHHVVEDVDHCVFGESVGDLLEAEVVVEKTLRELGTKRVSFAGVILEWAGQFIVEPNWRRGTCCRRRGWSRIRWPSSYWARKRSSIFCWPRGPYLILVH